MTDPSVLARRQRLGARRTVPRELPDRGVRVVGKLDREQAPTKEEAASRPEAAGRGTRARSRT